MDFKNSTDSFIELSARVKRLAKQFNIVEPGSKPEKSALETYRDKSKQCFYNAVSKLRAKQDATKEPDPRIEKSIKDGSNIYAKGLQIGGAATTLAGLPVEPGTYRLKDSSIIVVGRGSVILSIERG